MNRLQIEITGFVQGVGFRPFVYKLAKELQLSGWVCNDLHGVYIEIQGSKKILDLFLIKLKNDIPKVAEIVTCVATEITTITNELDFVIKFNEVTQETTAIISPDLATCSDCLQEIFDVNDRRYLYPFTNCTQCGPRFSIIKKLPYERYNTSMNNFHMCNKCHTEYHDVTCRRFHAQPNACWDCGPTIELIDVNKNSLARQQEALLSTAEAIKQGKIIAVKGLGGFHLVVDARDPDAVARLRQRKHRPSKPLAIMVPNLQIAQQLCIMNVIEEQLLISQQAPIILLAKKNHTIIAANVAPNNPYLGVMLPYMPLQHVLLKVLNFPIVATSGNFSGEPICKDVDEAIIKLSKIADVFLVHNRDIINRVDDSVVRIIKSKKIFYRRARGYAPYSYKNPKFTQPLLAVGANMKNTVAFASAGNVFLSQHIGDVDNLDAVHAFKSGINNLSTIYNFTPTKIACDLHPDYFSTKYAIKSTVNQVMIQHHHAHIAAVMLEKQLSGPVLGVAWDGTGLGVDGTIWGGEFLVTTCKQFTRVAHLDLLALPGGEKAIKQPNRIAIWMLTKLSDDPIRDFAYLPVMQRFKNTDLKLLLNMIATNINTSMTSSIGRLFDGVGSLVGLRDNVDFEGQAAIELEFLAEKSGTEDVYKFIVKSGKILTIDWKILIQQILVDFTNKGSKSVIAKKFHNTLVAIIICIAKKIGIKDVVLTGGCFQNKILLERTIEKLTENDFIAYWPEEIPINDGGIAIGQLAVANANL